MVIERKLVKAVAVNEGRVYERLRGYISCSRIRCIILAHGYYLGLLSSASKEYILLCINKAAYILSSSIIT